MIHKIESATNASTPILKRATEIKNGPWGHDDVQFRTSLHPDISNLIYEREQKIAENTKFSTLIALARVLDDENMSKAINALGYSIK